MGVTSCVRPLLLALLLYSCYVVLGDPRAILSFNSYCLCTFFKKSAQKTEAVVLAGRHLLCSQVAYARCKSIFDYAFTRLLATFFGRFVPCRSPYVASARAVQRLAALKHVSDFSEHCLTYSLRRATQPFRFQRRITLAMVFIVVGADRCVCPKQHPVGANRCVRPKNRKP